MILLTVSGTKNWLKNYNHPETAAAPASRLFLFLIQHKFCPAHSAVPGPFQIKLKNVFFTAYSNPYPESCPR